MNEIAIRIFWGPWEGELNPTPIVSVGKVVGCIFPSAPVLVNEEQSWKIKIDEWKAVYACYSKELCHDSEDYMQLLLCVILPKGKRLEGEKSPLDLLEEVRNQFDSLFSFDLEAALPPNEKVNADFGRLLEGYALTDCPWYVFNMEGSAPASYCVENRSQLDALMRFNAYPALVHVEHLELGFKCKTTVNFTTRGEANETTRKVKRKWWGKDKAEDKPKLMEKEPSRKEPIKEPNKETEKEKTAAEEHHKVVFEPEKSNHKGYQIVVNGQPVKDPKNIGRVKVLWEDSDEQYIVRCDSTLDCRYEPLIISVDKLRKAPNATLTSQNGTSKAVLDEAMQTITCTLNPIANWYKMEVKYDPKSDYDAKCYCMENMGKSIRILVDGQEWADKIQPSRVADQKEDGSIVFRTNRISISPEETDGYRFSVIKVVQDPSDQEKLCVFIKAKKKRARKPHGNDNKLATWWKNNRSLWIIAVVGIVLGALCFWAGQTIIRNAEERRIVKQEKGLEVKAWIKVRDLVPKNHEEANLCRDYLRNFSDAEISIDKGSGGKETIHGEFAYPDSPHITCVSGKLQKYVTDSIRAERDEEMAFEKCKDITTCEKYLEDYNPVIIHGYFEKGKHVDVVLDIMSNLEAAKAKDVQNEIKNKVDQTALKYLNKQDLKGFRTWLDEVNVDWKNEFGQNKSNRALLGKDKADAVERILAKIVEKEIMHCLKDEFNFPNKPFVRWQDVMEAKKHIE